MARAYHEGVDKPDEEKQCYQCRERFPLTQENFYTRRKNGKIYFSSYCVRCSNSKSKAYAKEQRERWGIIPNDYYERMEAARRAGLNKPISIADLAEEI